MVPDIRLVAEKKLIGQALSMTLGADRTPELWRGFMPRRTEIQQKINQDLYCLQVYNPPLDLTSFSESVVFDKWAAIEVSEFQKVPDGMNTFTLPNGLYAVFLYRGAPSAFGQFAQHIFFEWLPKSTYKLDNRPHLQVMGAGYKGESPDSEEEIWVPVTKLN